MRYEPHPGVDYVGVPGQDVVSPVDGLVKRWGVPYAGEEYKLIVIEVAPGLTVKMLYLEPALSTIRNHVSAGQYVGEMQDVSPMYEGITPHVHVSVYLNGFPIDPTNWLPGG